MIQFSPNWLTDQRFLETATVLQNPIPQRGSFVERKANPASGATVWHSGGWPLVGTRGAGGKRGR